MGCCSRRGCSEIGQRRELLRESDRRGRSMRWCRSGSGPRTTPPHGLDCRAFWEQSPSRMRGWPTIGTGRSSGSLGGRRSRNGAPSRSGCCGPAREPRIRQYGDVYYVEELIGVDTVNTIPPTTYDAFRDHGRVRPSLTENLDAARRTIERLDELGISLPEVTDRLLEDGLRLFGQAFDTLLAAVIAPRHARCRPVADRQRSCLPSDLSTLVDEAVEDWQHHGKVKRLWARGLSALVGNRREPVDGLAGRDRRPGSASGPPAPDRT